MSSLYRIVGESVQDITIDDLVPLEASFDAFDVRGSDNKLIRCKTIDTRCRLSAHCDHIQIIPTGLEPNAQYFGSIASNNSIIGGGLDSNGSMQGIFSSDGCHDNLYVADQTIDTESEHDITINGLLYGSFYNNKNKAKQPVKITLEPLRIGGGLPNSFYVLSFSDGHEYQKINTDQEIEDNRSKKLARYPNANYVHDFDLTLFREISESRADQYESIQQHFDDCLAEYESRSSGFSVDELKTVEELTKDRAMREIRDISIHCSATKEGMDIGATDIRRWHKNQGWSDIGYHYVIRIDGTVERGRPLYRSPAAVKGKNKNMIAICYVGGLDANTLDPKDTRTPEQKESLLVLLFKLRNKHPNAVIQGHRDYPKVAKACPCFDAKSEYSYI